MVNMFVKAAKGTPFYKVYQQKMTDKSFIDKTGFDATRTFLEIDKAALWAERGHIPDDVTCKVQGDPN